MLADLKHRLAADGKANAALLVNWSILEEWKEQSRYRIVGEADARSLLDAVQNPDNGVLTWLAKRS